MNPAKCTEELYIQWLIASPRHISATQAARTSNGLIAHDAYTRLLDRIEPDSQTLWDEVEPFVKKKEGYLVADDSTLDKPYAGKIELVTRHWSGKHRAVVQGINLVTLVWTDGEIVIPIDWRVFDKKNDGMSKNDHLQDMLRTAFKRGFCPEFVLWDSWYSSLSNLKLLRELGWNFFVAMKANRGVDPDGKGNRAISTLEFEDGRRKTHLKGYGWVIAHKTPNQSKYDEEKWRYFVSNVEDLEAADVQHKRETAVQIEQYHRGLKQECHVERCQARKGHKQRNHIGLAIRAFLRLEIHRYRSGISRFQAKMNILLKAIGQYLTDPLMTLPAL